MIPNRYAKDQHPLHFYPPPHAGQPYPTSIFIPPILGMDYMEQQKALERAQANMQVNNSIDSLLHVHRRKLQRRAANRKSAQLSRARKKVRSHKSSIVRSAYCESFLQAHLEELTVENARLQQLVDILDSQPELMFCINARGDITYVSERTVNFVNITGVDGGSDEEPTHILQILRKDSVDSVLSSIQEIMRVSPPKSALAESSMLFSTKVSV
jgi:PAS domain-containing protein